MARKEIEARLGQLMHRVSLQQDKVAEEQKALQKLQQEANEVNEELSKLDVK